MGSVIEIETGELTQGDHILKRVRRIAAEWLSEDAGAIAFRDMVVEELERLTNGFPDYDTGYFSVENGGNTYVMKHEFGKVPSKATLFFSTSPTPQSGDYTVIEVPSYSINDSGGAGLVGMQLSHDPDGTRSSIFTRATYVYWDYESGYLRVMLWR